MDDVIYKAKNQNVSFATKKPLIIELVAQIQMFFYSVLMKHSTSALKGREITFFPNFFIFEP